MDIFKAVVFGVHFLFFGLTALLFFLKFHKRSKLKIVFFSAAAIWIIFGIIDFVLALRGIILSFI